MGSGPTKTTTTDSTQNTQQQQHQADQQSGWGNSGSQSQGGQTAQTLSTTTPNISPEFAAFKNSLMGQFGTLYNQFGQQAQKPLYGPAQQANFQESLNRQLGGAQQGLLSSLASRGALNSGDAAQTQTGLQLGGVQQLQNYLANVPLQNAQFKQQALGNQLGVLNSANNFTLPFGTTTQGNSSQDQWSNMLQQYLNGSSGTSDMNGSSSSTGHSTQTEKTSGGLLNSILSGVIKAGLGFATGGLSNILGGGGFLSPAG